MKNENTIDREIDIRRVLGRWDKDRSFISVGWATPEVFEDDDLRSAAQRSLDPQKEAPAFDKNAADELWKQIDRIGKELKKEKERAQAMDAAIGVTVKDITTLADIEESYTMRIATGYEALDHLFGSSKRYDDQFNVISEDFGLARGKLMLMGGEEGAGKTRFYTAMAIKMVVEGLKVVIFQGEMGLEEYKELVMNMCRSMKILLSEEAQRRLYILPHRRLEEQVSIIRDISPDFAVVDSFPMIHGAKRDEGIEDIVFQWKRAIGDYTAALFIAHLNEKKQIKGNNLIRYLVDACYTMELEPLRGAGIISVTVAKTRIGVRGVKIFMQHFDGRMLVYDWGNEPALPLDVPNN